MPILFGTCIGALSPSISGSSQKIAVSESRISRRDNLVSKFLSARSIRLEHSGSQVVLTPEQKYKEFPVQTFPQLLDHWDEDSPTFLQRYWVNKRHYRPGGPVFLLDGGETSGVEHLPFLDTGIVDILAEATNGVGIVLEHRYYGIMICHMYI
jgi:hypothetical protein